MKNRSKLVAASAVMAVLVIAVFFTACKKDSVKKDVFSGYAQKGPFAMGSSVTISELNAKLTQTGKTYFTTISDNLGSFELTDIEFASNYVQLKVEGSYFHEFAGMVVPVSVPLYALVDIRDVNSANVNILTHLEKPRVEYLVKQEKKSFSAAKKQAQLEVLAIFGFTPSNTSSEALDLRHDGMLLAISSIFLAVPYYGGLTDMMEFMANISEDIKTDGILSNTSLGTKLIHSAYRICIDDGTSFSLDKVRENMEARYAELGINISIPNFESYIQSFANSKRYPLTETPSIYPQNGLYGDNILSDAVTSVNRGQNYSMRVNSQQGEVVINILCAKETDFYYLYDKEVIGNWGLTSQGGGKGVAFGGSNGDMLVQIFAEEYITIEYYEYGSKVPSKTKILRVEN